MKMTTSNFWLLAMPMALMLVLKSTAFSTTLPFAVRSLSATATSSRSSSMATSTENGGSSGTDEYDAWLEQLDPSAFEEEDDAGFASAPSSSSRGDRSRGDSSRGDRGSSPFRPDSRGGPSSSSSRGPPRERRSSNNYGNSRQGGHDYQRDFQADDSRVPNEEAVHELIAQRNQARRRREFDLADDIRNELLQKHGVALMDRERMWRTGASDSGSGGGGRWGAARGGGRDGGGRGDRNNNSWGRDDSNERGGRGGARDRFQPRGGRDGGRGGRGPPQDFGPNGHDYELSQDAGPNQSNLSEEKINELLAQRLQCKLVRNFRQADEIQNELFHHGVFVHDGNKEWRADGVGFGNSGGGKRGYDDPNPGRTQGSRADLNGPYQMSDFSLPLMDEQQIQELKEKAGDDDDNEELLEQATEELRQRIQALVDERLEARQDRNYEVADALRDDLKLDYNVGVCDRRREWSVGGIFQKSLGSYEMSPYSLPISSLIENYNEDEDNDETIAQLQQKIQGLMDERDEAKRLRDFDTADAIRDELSSVYNVAIADRERVWSIGSNFQAPPQPYTMSSFSTPPPEGLDVDRVSEMCQERDDARQQREYDVADEIKFELLEDYNIAIDDRLRQWSVGGVFEDGPTRGARDSSSSGIASAAGLTRRGGGSLSEQEIATIEELLEERAAYKAQKNYGKADRIRDQLGSEFQVRVDDRSMEWHVVTNDYTYVPSSSQASLSQDTIDYIQKQINERAVAKLNNDYDTADDIRYALMEEFGVSMDDRVKEWTVEVDRADAKDANDSATYDSSASGGDEDDDQENVQEMALERHQENFDVEEADMQLEESFEIDQENEEEEEEEDEDDMDIANETATEEADEEASEEADGDDTSSLDTDSLEKLTVVELKDRLRSKGLPVSGRKAELIERLIE